MTLPNNHFFQIPDTNGPRRFAPDRAAGADDRRFAKINDKATKTWGSGMNPYRDVWLETINADKSLSPDAYGVALVIGDSVGIGRIAFFTNWQRVNIALGRNKTDHQVFKSIRELQAAGYLGRHQDRYNQSRGWSLSLPEGEL